MDYFFSAAVLSALITALVTRLDDIIKLFQGSTRKISGDWEGITDPRPTGADDKWDKKDKKPDIKFFMTLSQTGQKVNGYLTMTDAPKHVIIKKICKIKAG